jgi:feruloyl-CoA synthase
MASVSALTQLARDATGSSNRPTRALILDRPATLDTGELTDKGAVSQRTMLSLRASDVRRLHARDADRAVIQTRKPLIQE